MVSSNMLAALPSLLLPANLISMFSILSETSLLQMLNATKLPNTQPYEQMFHKKESHEGALKASLKINDIYCFSIHKACYPVIKGN